VSIEQVHEWVRDRDRALFNVFSCQGSEPSEDDVRAFEAQCGFRLPEEFRDFTMSSLGGLYVGAKEEVWPRAKLYEVGPFWSFLCAVKVFGISENVPEWLDIRLRYAELAEAGHPPLVPFLQRGGDMNLFCFTRAGEIVEWDHVTSEEPHPVEGSFSDLLLRELHDLEDRTRRRMRNEHLSGGR
jgi:hypothetical protein